MSVALARASRAAAAAFAALKDPSRADAVATLGELTGPTTLLRMHDVCFDATGRRVLALQPRVRTLQHLEVQACPYAHRRSVA